MSDVEWKTIKIPVAAYEQAKTLREEIMRRGVDALPPALRSAVLDAEGRRGIGIGTVVFLGLVGLGLTLDVASKSARKQPAKRRR